MKKTVYTIPKKKREGMALDPNYKFCTLTGHHGHECGGKITWEHSIIYAGRRLQLPWSIIPICERAHAINTYQDAGTMKKELNVWVALNRATDDELQVISKATDYIRERARLNEIYGVWSPRYTIPEFMKIGINYAK